MKNQTLIYILIFLAVAGAVFYVGMYNGKKSQP